MKAPLRYLIVFLVGFTLIFGLGFCAGYFGYKLNPLVHSFVIICIFGLCKFLNDLLKQTTDNNQKDEE